MRFRQGSTSLEAFPFQETSLTSAANDGETKDKAERGVDWLRGWGVKRSDTKGALKNERIVL